MERFSPLKIVKEKLNSKKQENINNADPIEQEKLEFISTMLNNERCFFEINQDIAIEILSFLGFDDNEIFDLYDQLTNYELFAGNFNFIDAKDNEGAKKN